MHSLDPVQSNLISLFDDAGFTNVDPPILYPSALFLDLAGQDIGRRLFRTTDEDGNDKCLRPDFTIPIANYYMENDLIGQSASFYYSGIIFRKRTQQIGEIHQVGVELIGSNEAISADVNTLNLANQSIVIAGIENPRVKIGDEAIFSAIVNALDLPAVWNKRLINLFGDRNRINRAILRMSGKKNNNERSDNVFAYFSKHHPAKITASAVENYMSLEKIIPIGERSSQEIAERLQEKITLTTKIEKEKTDLLTAYLEINGNAEYSADKIRSFEKNAQIDISDAISRYQDRIDQIRSSNLDTSSIEFSADFGRRLNYYTGFIFEIYNSLPEANSPLCGGGRYDHLLKLLGAPQEIPAIGFSIWLERLSGEKR